MQVVKSKQATVMAAIKNYHYPSVLAAIKRSITYQVNTTCGSLCKHSGGSVLYGNDYKTLREFDFDKIWDEMKAISPFLINLMNSLWK